MKETGKCCICGDQYEYFGNNPDPVSTKKHDRACTFCDRMFVIPARLGAQINSNNLRRLAKELKAFGPENVKKLLEIYFMLRAGDEQWAKQMQEMAKPVANEPR